MENKKLHFVLASQSPRRKKILEDAGFIFETLSSNSSESFDENLTLEENLREIVKDKILSVLPKLSQRKHARFLILAADTVVVCGKKILGKPKAREDAARTIRLLAGKMHRVMTAFALFHMDKGLVVTQIVTTHVRFRKISEAEIRSYIDSGEPFDKAGSYGIQDSGGSFVNLVRGDLQNVIGLPLFAVKRELKRRRWDVDVKRQISTSHSKNQRS
jgi:septum formation protein